MGLSLEIYFDLSLNDRTPILLEERCSFETSLELLYTSQEYHLREFFEVPGSIVFQQLSYSNI